jgi:hypothetical protein
MFDFDFVFVFHVNFDGKKEQKTWKGKNNLKSSKKLAKN